MDLLVCSGCGARVAGPAEACPLCRGALRATVAGTWTGAFSADGQWTWDGGAWRPVATPAPCRYCGASLQPAWVACPRCGAPAGARVGQPATAAQEGSANEWISQEVSQEERVVFTKEVRPSSLAGMPDIGALRASLERDAARLAGIRCPKCGQQDFEARSVNRGPLQVRCRRCGAAVPF